MEITKKHWLTAGIGLAIAVLGIAGVTQFVFLDRVVTSQSEVFQSPVIETTNATTTVSNSETTPLPATVSVSQNRPTIAPPSIQKGDVISSWEFTGAYAGNPELIAKANAEITRLSGLLGQGTYPDVSLYVGIANQYELLGDGTQAYDYLGRAIEEGGETTGLPWHNLGVLMERLRALETARVAYQNATTLQPQIKQWHYAYLEFLTLRMAGRVADIEKAFAEAFSRLGDDVDILSLQSEWKKS